MSSICAKILAVVVSAALSGCAKQEKDDCWLPDEERTDGVRVWSLETNDTVESMYWNNSDGICIQAIKWVYCQGYDSERYPGAFVTCWDADGLEVDMRGPAGDEVVDTFICMAGCDIAWGGAYMCPLNSCESWAAQWGVHDLVPFGCTKRTRWALWLNHLSPESQNFRCRVTLEDGYNFEDYEGKNEECIDQEYCYNGCDEYSPELCDETRGKHE